MVVMRSRPVTQMTTRTTSVVTLLSAAVLLISALPSTTASLATTEGGQEGTSTLNQADVKQRELVDRSCSLIRRYHCSYFRPDPHCGTDGVTYGTMCDFLQAHCLSRDLGLSHAGACPPTSPPPPDPTPTSGDDVHRLFCNNLDQRFCDDDTRFLCGSDGVTYNSLCEFEKSRCRDPSITLSGTQACPASSP